MALDEHHTTSDCVRVEYLNEQFKIHKGQTSLNISFGIVPSMDQKIDV